MGARQLIVLLLAAMPAAAQYLIDSDEAGRVAPFFDKYSGRNSIGCELILYRPRVGYTFRIQTAYNATFPLQSYQGSEKLAVLTRVTPEDKEKGPYYLSQGMTIPGIPKDAPRKSVFGGVTGAFHVGEGRYRVDLLVVDSNDRFCRKSWKISATREKHVQGMANAIPPGEVRPLVIRPWHRQIMNASCPAPIKKMTVLLHAENFRRGSAKVGTFGHSTLLSSVSSLIEQTPCASVRLIAFNLNQQREIFRQEGFTQYDLGKLSEAMDSLSLGTVNIRTLNNVGGGAELMLKLLDEERTAREPADVVVVMSPILGGGKKLKRELVGAREGNKPMFFYLDFRPVQLASWPNDWASEFVKALDGKLIHIFDPDSLAVAIQKVHKATDDAATDPAGN